jgi:hypothetical protein
MAITHKATLRRIKEMIEIREKEPDYSYCPWTESKIFSFHKPSKRYCKSCATVMQTVEKNDDGSVLYYCPCNYYEKWNLDAFEIAKQKVKEAGL